MQAANASHDMAGLAPFWEVAKGVMLTLTTGAVLWIARTVFVLRDEVRDLNLEVLGRDGSNGLAAAVAALDTRVKVMEDRNLVVDAVADIEKSEYLDDERRHGLRTLRSLIRSETAELLKKGQG